MGKAIIIKKNCPFLRLTSDVCIVMKYNQSCKFHDDRKYLRQKENQKSKKKFNTIIHGG